MSDDTPPPTKRRRPVLEVETPIRRSSPIWVSSSTTPPGSVQDARDEELGCGESDDVPLRPRKRLHVIDTPSSTATSPVIESRNKGKGRALGGYRSRSRSVRPSRSIQSRNRSRTSDPNRWKRRGSLCSIASDGAFVGITGIRRFIGPRAGPSGATIGRREVTDSGPERLANTIIDLIGDSNTSPATIEKEPDINLDDELPELVYSEKATLLNDDQGAVARRLKEDSADDSCCAICYVEVHEILRKAEEAGHGGLGGCLALWVCEQASCGALFCLSCAIAWTNEAHNAGRQASCPHCTRPTDLASLRAQAVAFDPTRPIEDNPIHPLRAPSPSPFPPRNDRVRRGALHIVESLRQFNNHPVYIHLGDGPDAAAIWRDWYLQRAFDGLNATLIRGAHWIERAAGMAMDAFHAQRRAAQRRARPTEPEQFHRMRQRLNGHEAAGTMSPRQAETWMWITLFRAHNEITNQQTAQLITAMRNDTIEVPLLFCDPHALGVIGAVPEVVLAYRSWQYCQEQAAAGGPPPLRPFPAGDIVNAAPRRRGRPPAIRTILPADGRRPVPPDPTNPSAQERAQQQEYNVRITQSEATNIRRLHRELLRCVFQGDPQDLRRYMQNIRPEVFEQYRRTLWRLLETNDIDMVIPSMLANVDAGAAAGTGHPPLQRVQPQAQPRAVPPVEMVNEGRGTVQTQGVRPDRAEPAVESPVPRPRVRFSSPDFVML